MGINFYRKIFHLGFGFFLFGLSYFVSYHLLGLLLVSLVILNSVFEVLRLFFYDYLPLKRLWTPLLKKEEFYKISDGWFYLVGTTCLYYLVGREDFRLILLILTLSDPIASLVGFYLGKKKIFRGKTLEGGVAFFLMSLLVVLLLKGSLTFQYFGLTALLSFIELLTKRDNFWIPLVGGLYLKYLV
jgi:dolichol kinase